MGLKHLNGKNTTKAVEYFEYARDIDSETDVTSPISAGEYLLAPERNAREGESFCAKHGRWNETDTALFLYGKYLTATGSPKKGRALKRAAELKPEKYRDGPWKPETPNAQSGSIGFPGFNT